MRSSLSDCFKTTILTKEYSKSLKGLGGTDNNLAKQDRIYIYYSYRQTVILMSVSTHCETADISARMVLMVIECYTRYYI